MPFSVDPDSGWVKVTQPIDREQQDRYDLVIQAADAGDQRQVSTANVKVTVQDVNDNKPRFDRDTFMVNLLEKTPVGSVLLYPKALDEDAGDNGM